MESENRCRFRFCNVELGYNQQLSFLPGLLSGTNVNVSYSRSYANLRKSGTVPHKVSDSIGWNCWRVNVRLSGVWLDDAQWGLSRNGVRSGIRTESP